MFNRINSIAQGIKSFVDRTEYVFAIFVWAVKALRSLSDILASFPKPPVSYESKGSETDKNTGDAGAVNGEGAVGNGLSGTP